MSKSKDLFDETTMSFGDHLEELRVCLWRALIGLMIGVVGGLFIGKPIVYAIKIPIEEKLNEYYDEQLEEARAEPQNSTPDSEPIELLLTLEDDQIRELLRQLQQGGAEIAQVPDGDLSVSLRAILSKVPPELADATVPINPFTQPFGSGPLEPFLTYLKVSLIAGLVFSSPWVFYQIWSFVAAGLYSHEKHYVYLFLPVSLGLFLGGVFFCFFLVLRFILNYLFTFNSWLGITPLIRISEWISFAVMLPLMFGLGFQLPLVMLFLERIGIFTVDDYRAKRRVAVLVIAVVAMMLTPPDPGSMVLLLGPMILLYEGGIWLVVALRRRSPFEERATVP